MNIYPIGRRIYIRPEQLKTVIQTTDKNNLIERGEVIAVGPEVRFNIKVGSRLLFTSWGVDKVVIDGEDCFFLIDSDEFILGIIREPEETAALLAELEKQQSV